MRLMVCLNYESSCHVLTQVLEGKPIFADCFGNLVPLTKSGQHHVFSFFAFKENRLALFIKVCLHIGLKVLKFLLIHSEIQISEYMLVMDWIVVFIDEQIRDTAQEPCGRLSFTKEPRTYRSLNHNAICNLNITLPTYSKVSLNVIQFVF